MSEPRRIETERLILRPYETRDVERILDIHSRLEVIRWLSNPPYTPMADLDEAHAWIARWAGVHEQNPRLGGWAIEVRATGVVAGTVLLAELPQGDGRVQIGWHLHPDSAGHGYATEAAAEILALGFELGLPEIWVDMYPDNAPSAAVAMRLGIPDLGVRDDPWYGGDSRMFLMTAEQWEARLGPSSLTP